VSVTVPAQVEVEDPRPLEIRIAPQRETPGNLGEPELCELPKLGSMDRLAGAEAELHWWATERAGDSKRVRQAHCAGRKPR
jgi:hypothetical protein